MRGFLAILRGRQPWAIQDVALSGLLIEFIHYRAGLKPHATQDFALSGLGNQSRRDEIFSAEGETLSDVKKKRFNPEGMTYVAPLGL